MEILLSILTVMNNDYLKETRVCNLLDTSGSWDLELLRDIFTDHDVERIRRTPVSPIFPDEWYGGMI
nr:uncharacterized protein LOC109160522 [Ipomoea trifida]